MPKTFISVKIQIQMVIHILKVTLTYNLLTKCGLKVT
jgi:hypothetical protein